MKGFIYGALDTYTLSISDINAESWAINKFVVNALIGEQQTCGVALNE